MVWEGVMIAGAPPHPGPPPQKGGRETVYWTYYMNRAAKLDAYGARRASTPATQCCCLHPENALIRSFLIEAKFVESDVLPVPVQWKRFEQLGVIADGFHLSLMQQHYPICSLDSGKP